jgi:hypothetical protein
MTNTNNQDQDQDQDQDLGIKGTPIDIDAFSDSADYPMMPSHSTSLVFVIDGEVADVLHTDERLAAIFLSEPEIIEIGLVPVEDTPLRGQAWDSKKYQKYIKKLNSNTE